MRLIERSLIAVPPDRQRQSFSPMTLVELSNSIATVGLINPITVRQSTDGLILVAGERRIRAIEDLWALGDTFTFEGRECPKGWLPCVEAGRIDELLAEETEWAENRERDPLSWQEQARAAARLESIRSRRAAAAGLAPPTVADLSLELRGSDEGYQHEATRRELIVARHLDDPEVAAAKSADDAFKTLKRKEVTRKNAELAATFGATYTADTHSLHHTDALEWLLACPESQFDVILTDPPYGMGADEFGDAGGRTQGAHGYSDDWETVSALLTRSLEHFYRVAKPQAHLYLFCDLDAFGWLRQQATSLGWWVHRTPLIWHKPSNPRLPWPEHGPQRKWEMLLYAVKGKKPVIKIAPDLVTYPSDTNLGHAAQKPIALFQDLLSRSVRPGDAVLDAFCGTGPIFPAAHALRCRAVGVERDPAAYAVAATRIRQLKEQLEIAL